MKATNSSKEIKAQFQNAINLQQSCKVYLTTANGDSWSFYFKKGALIWASSSIHRFRRLYRITNQVCPEVNCQDIKLREQEISELWEYLLISVLHKRLQIDVAQTGKIIRKIVKEVLFDCLLAADKVEQIKVIFETKENNMGAILRSPLLKQPIAQLDYKKAISSIELLLSDWQAVNIADIADSADSSPNLAPVIVNIARLQKAETSNVHKHLFTLINGKKSIRDLAVITKQDILSLLRALAPHIKSKAIALQQIPDQQLANLYFTPGSQDTQAKFGRQSRASVQELDLPLIVCIDDNPNICLEIAQILNPAGYRLIPVNDAAKTLLVLMEQKPSLIFLDGVMPDISGYELCTQIKKMTGLKHVPVVILQSKGSLIDRVKAKMSGASDCLSKPINAAEILTLAQKHTQIFADQTDTAISYEIGKDIGGIGG